MIKNRFSHQPSQEEPRVKSEESWDKVFKEPLFADLCEVNIEATLAVWKGNWDIAYWRGAMTKGKVNNLPAVLIKLTQKETGARSYFVLYEEEAVWHKREDGIELENSQGPTLFPQMIQSLVKGDTITAKDGSKWELAKRENNEEKRLFAGSKAKIPEPGSLEERIVNTMQQNNQITNK